MSDTTNQTLVLLCMQLADHNLKEITILAIKQFPRKVLEDFIVEQIIKEQDILPYLILASIIDVNLQTQQIIIYRFSQYLQTQFKGSFNVQLSSLQANQNQIQIEKLILELKINNIQTIFKSYSGAIEQVSIRKVLSESDKDQVQINSVIVLMMSIFCEPEKILKQILSCQYSFNEETAFLFCIMILFIFKKLQKDIIKQIFQQYHQQLLVIFTQLSQIVNQTLNQPIKVYLCKFYFTSLYFIDVASVSSLHQFFIQNLHKLLEQILQIRTFQTQLTKQFASQLKSPFVIAILGYKDGQQENKIIQDQILFIVEMTQDVIQMNLDSQLKQQQQQTFKLFNFNKNQNSTVSVSIIKLMLQNIVQIIFSIFSLQYQQEFLTSINDRLIITIEISLIKNIDSLQDILEPYMQSDNKLQVLKLLSLLCKDIKRQQYNIDIDETLQFFGSQFYLFIYDELKYQKTTGQTLVSFQQLDVQYLSGEQETRLKYYLHLKDFCFEILCIYNEFQVKNQNQRLFDIFAIMIEYISESKNTNYLEQVLVLIKTNHELQKCILKVLFNTLYYRQYSVCNDPNKKKILNFKQKNLSITIINMIQGLLQNGNIKNYEVIDIMLDQKINFVKWMSIFTQFLIYQEDDDFKSIFDFRKSLLDINITLFSPECVQKQIVSYQNFFKIKQSQNEQIDIITLLNKFTNYSNLLKNYYKSSNAKIEKALSYSNLLPGVKWQYSSKKEEMKLNYQGFLEQELNEASIQSITVEESEYDEKILSMKVQQFTISEQNKYYKGILLFVFDILSSVNTDISYQFYEIFKVLNYSRNSTNQFEISFTYRLQILGFVQKLTTFTSQSYQQYNLSPQQSIITNECKELLLNTYNTKDQYDIQFLIEAISANSFMAILLLLKNLQETNSLANKYQLQIFQVSLNNASVRDILTNFAEEDVTSSQQHMKIYVPNKNEIKMITENLISMFQYFLQFNIYKTQILNAIQICQVIQFITKMSNNIDNNYFVPQIMIVIQYLLVHSSFKPSKVIYTKSQNNKFIVTDQQSLTYQQIADSNGYQIMSNYFTKNYYQEQYLEYIIPQYYQDIFAALGLLPIYTQQIFVQGKISQIFHAAVLTLDCFIDIISNFNISNKIVLLMMNKALSLLSLQDDQNSKQFYDTQIAPRIVCLLTRIFEVNPSSSILEIIFQHFIDECSQPNVVLLEQFLIIVLELIKQSPITKFLMKQTLQSVYVQKEKFNITYQGPFSMIKNPIQLLQKLIRIGSQTSINTFIQIDYVTNYLQKSILTNEQYLDDVLTLRQYLDYKKYDDIEFLCEILYNSPLNEENCQLLLKIIDYQNLNDNSKTQIISGCILNLIQTNNPRNLITICKELIFNNILLFYLVIISQLQKDTSSISIYETLLQQFMNEQQIEFQKSIIGLITDTLTGLMQQSEQFLEDPIFSALLIMLGKIDIELYTGNLISLLILYSIYPHINHTNFENFRILGIFSRLDQSLIKFNSLDDYYKMILKLRKHYVLEQTITQSLNKKYQQAAELFNFLICLSELELSPSVENFSRILDYFVNVTQTINYQLFLYQHIKNINFPIFKIENEQRSTFLQFLTNNFEEQVISSLLQIMQNLGYNLLEFKNQINLKLRQNLFSQEIFDLFLHYNDNDYTKFILEFIDTFILFIDNQTCVSVILKWTNASNLNSALQQIYKGEFRGVMKQLQQLNDINMIISALKVCSIISPKSSVEQSIKLFNSLKDVNSKKLVIKLLGDMFKLDDMDLI
ncbi:hypothetical protein SS50377_27992 [Spironucleus salmonicida]|uniref:Uncharacterized protein n=1 Tax=Spironucleus salmonicida TaxID=348837 RepID=V6LP96_9EUKA|nr:hypothetical protein SS50377_27992 [Spironucleus salmonicida]|eukprot:EST42549.1 Hypothetical protein SS50377_17863 [Spironucleus salmonicida]